MLHTPCLSLLNVVFLAMGIKPLICENEWLKFGYLLSELYPNLQFEGGEWSE